MKAILLIAITWLFLALALAAAWWFVTMPLPQYASLIFSVTL